MSVAESAILTGQSATGESPPLIDLLLAQQQDTSAVVRFAQRHEDATKPLLADYYRDLIPLSRPAAGEQYAFEVDLDACSGCKACVTACHNQNGLDPGEQWRSVGMLHGGPEQSPIVQHVTAACHHCVDPACLTGCPVLAYEKDPQTGIVRHLDDQCIGCQYCIFMCPYDVPQYNAAKGIIRKCDMCHDRLAADEAPACVQACPNRAIRIRTVSVESVIEASETAPFLPGAPEPGITLPTTVYKSKKPLPRNALPADYFAANPAHSHLPLVVMLVLTQLSVGASLVGQVLVSGPWREPLLLAAVLPAYAVAAFLLGLAGMHAAVFHLGRPRFAFRALLGLRTSWLSREILVFGAFACLAFAYAATLWLAVERPHLVVPASVLGVATAAAGVLGVFCSVMIYVMTRRPLWSGHRTAGTFFLTCLVLGIPAALLVSLAACYGNAELSSHAIMRKYGQTLCRWLIVLVAAKLALEASVLLHLRVRTHTPIKRTALLLTGQLSMTSMLRYFFAAMGGLLLPLVLLLDKATMPGDAGYQPMFVGFVVLLILGLLLLGELLERYLFFAASVAPKMPGAMCG